MDYLSDEQQEEPVEEDYYGVIYKEPLLAPILGKLLVARFYLNQVAWLQTKPHPAGWYLSPYLKARRLRYINEVGYGFTKVGDLDEIIIRSIGFGVVGGYQWGFRKNFLVDVFLGGGRMPVGLSSYQHTMRYSSVISTNGYEYYQNDFRAGVSLGYSF